MKIAVITPFKNEVTECIQRCIDCIQQQTHPAYMHIIICDGAAFPLEKKSLPGNVLVIELPEGCEDTGASPRAIGSIYAMARHAEGLAYLDIDNTVTADHISNAIKQAQQGAHVVIADRWICDYNTGEPLFLDNIESGVNIVDTNTLFLFGKAMPPGAQWWQVPRKPGIRTAGVDRYIWEHISRFSAAHNLKIVRTGQPTVFYRSRWEHHYRKVGKPAPSPKKTLVNIDGIIVAKWIN